MTLTEGHRPVQLELSGIDNSVAIPFSRPRRPRHSSVSQVTAALTSPLAAPLKSRLEIQPQGFALRPKVCSRPDSVLLVCTQKARVCARS